MTLRLPLTLIVLATAAAADTGRPDEASRLLAAVEQRHRALSDLETRFVQVYRSGALGQEVVERGVFRFKRPGMMRWEYNAPEKKLFVSDGRSVYFYVPADRQVVVQEQAGLQSLAFRLLAGEGGLARDFDAVLETGEGGHALLTLTPRQPDPEIERLQIEVDTQRRIRAIEILDLQGSRNRLRFEGLKENRGLPERLFRFEIPQGVEVVRG